MDPETTDPHALRLARRLRVSQTAAGDPSWTDPTTGTICVLQADGVYQVLRITADRAVPVIVGLLGSPDARELLSRPTSRRAKRAAANVIAIVDEH